MPYQSNNRIADLLLEVGNAKARAEQQSGAAWGNAIQNLGEIGSRTITSLLDQKKQATHLAFEQTQTAAAQLKLAEDKKALVEGDAFKSILKNTPMAAEDGLSLYDIPTLGKQLSAAGVDPTPYLGHLQQINAAFRAEQQAKTALVSVGAQKIIAAGNDPTLAHHFIDQLEANGSFSKDQLQQYRAFIDADPANVAKLTAYLSGPQKMENATPGSMARNSLTGQVVPGSQVPDRPLVVGPGASVVPPQGGAPLYTSPRATSLQSENVLLDGKPAMVTFDPNTGKRTNAAGEDVTARVKPIPSAAMVNIQGQQLSAPALDQAAKKYLDSGVLPAGMGMGAQRTAIQNRAAEMDPTAVLARNAAVFKADSANLTNLQRTEGTLAAFEKTAIKNLDQFLALADKIPDTGVPWLNTPVRRLSANVVGSANMAAIQAARDVAFREIARVTNDPKLSGALTDSARAEVMGLSKENATLPQIKAVARVLKQDVANVHKGINEQIADVKSGMGSNPSTPPPTEFSVTAPNGKNYQFATQQQLDAFKKQAGIP